MWGLFASPIGGPTTFSCHSFHPLAQSQPTVRRTRVELISPGLESGGNCLFLAYDSPRMRWATEEQGEGGGRRKRNFRAWRAREDRAQLSP